MPIRSLIPFGRNSSIESFSKEGPLLNLWQQMDRMFEDFARDWKQISEPRDNMILNPKVNVSETEQGLEIQAELPGVDQKDIQVELSNGILTLKAERKYEKEEKKKKYFISESAYGTFMRSFDIPADFDAEKVTAAFNKGVLKISIPRLPGTQPKSKYIEIKSEE